MTIISGLFNLKCFLILNYGMFIYTGLSSPVDSVNNLSMKVYIILYCKTGGYRVNLLLLFFFFNFLSETKCRYSLKPPRRGGSNVCLQSMF